MRDRKLAKPCSCGLVDLSKNLGRQRGSFSLVPSCMPRQWLHAVDQPPLRRGSHVRRNYGCSQHHNKWHHNHGCAQCLGSGKLSSPRGMGIQGMYAGFAQTRKAFREEGQFGAESIRGSPAMCGRESVQLGTSTTTGTTPAGCSLPGAMQVGTPAPRRQGGKAPGDRRLPNDAPREKRCEVDRRGYAYEHGKLKLSGAQLVNLRGDAVQLMLVGFCMSLQPPGL